MKILLDVADDKAPALLEVLEGLSFVKTKSVKGLAKENILKGLKGAVKDVRLAKQGKKQLKSLDELLNEL